MRFNKWTLGLGAVIAAVICMVATPVLAAIDNDVYSTVRIVQIGTPGTLAAAAPIVQTNGPVDILGYGGTGFIIFNTGTNAGGTLTATIETGSDTNTWAGLANFALINSTTAVNITNLFIGTNQVTTDNYLLPFLATSPTASTSGFATPYPNMISGTLAFTNAAQAITMTKAGTYVVGIRLTDCPRYLHVIWNATGAATNGATYQSAQLIGTRFIAP